MVPKPFWIPPIFKVPGNLVDQNALDKITFVVLESQLKLALYEQVFEGRVTLMPCIVTISKFFLIDLVSVLSTTFLNNSRFVYCKVSWYKKCKTSQGEILMLKEDSMVSSERTHVAKYLVSVVNMLRPLSCSATVASHSSHRALVLFKSQEFCKWWSNEPHFLLNSLLWLIIHLHCSTGCRC